MNQIFRSGETTISAAINKGTACWAVDDETLIKMRLRGIKFIGVLVTENRDIWLAPIEYFSDRTKTRDLSYEARTGGQKYLPLQHFRYKPGKLKL